MVNTKRIIKSIIWIAIISIALMLYLRLGATYNTMEVGFYGLSDKEVTVLSDWLNDRNIDWEPIVFDSSIPLEEQLDVPLQQNLLFTKDGKNMDSVAPYVRTAKTQNLLLMPVSIRTAVQTNGRLTATPILLDHYQLSYNIEALRNAGISIPTNFIDLEAIAQEIITERQGVSSVAPILCAGANDDDLIQFFSSMLETMHGIKSYEAIQALLEQSIEGVKGNDTLEEDVFNAFFELPQVYSTLQQIATWENRGFLSSSWLNVSRDDLHRAMENESAIFTFMLFSDYETLTQGAKSSYAPWFMPSGGQRDTRYLVAPSIVVMEFSYVKSPFQSARQSAKKNNLAASIISELVSGFNQTAISEAGGLAPVNSSAQVSELGAGETLQLFELSDGIIPDIAALSFVRQSDRAYFAQNLRLQLQQIENEM